jgi:hypothetical protein
LVATRRYTTADLDTLPDPEEGARYEIIDGELIVSRQPTMGHQDACNELATVLRRWSRATGRGWAVSAPGVIFAEDQNVAPDVVWISTDRLQAALDERGHLRDAPELMVLQQYRALRTCSDGANSAPDEEDQSRDAPPSPAPLLWGPAGGQIGARREPAPGRGPTAGEPP